MNVFVRVAQQRPRRDAGPWPGWSRRKGSIPGLRIGDLVTHAGTKQLTTVADLANVSTPSLQTPLLLRVVRDGSASFIVVTGTDERR
jgi:hypothetical protein